MTSFIQVPRIIDEVAQDLRTTLHESTEADGEDRTQPGGGNSGFDGDSAALQARQGGYVQAIDVDGILQRAAENDLRIRLLCRPGHHVAEGDVLARIFPERPFDEATAGTLHEFFVIGVRRTNSQDVEFTLDQLVEIALRALSPGINDPFTALNCIDRMGEALLVLCGRRFPPDLHRDAKGTPRLLVEGHTDESLLAATFNPQRQYGCSHPAVAIRLLETITLLAGRTGRDRLRHALRDHAARIRDACRHGVIDAGDLRDIEGRYDAAITALG